MKRLFRRPRALLACAALGLLVAGGLSLGARHDAPLAAHLTTGRAAVAWPAGIERDYAMVWRAHSRATLLQSAQAEAADPGHDGAIDVATRLEGQVRVRGLGPREGMQVLSVRIVSVTTLELSFAGRDSVADPNAAKQELTSAEAFVWLGERGTVQAVSFPREAAPAARDALQAIVEEMQVTFAEQPSSAWDATETSPNGLATVRYVAEDDGKTLTRTRRAYSSLTLLGGTPMDGPQRLRAEDSIVLDPRGGLATLRAEEELEYASGQPGGPTLASSSLFTLTNVGVTRRASPESVVVATELQPLGAPAIDPSAAARRDERLAEGLSVEVIDATIEAFEGGTKLEHGWLRRASTFLRLHPEACALLEAKFEDGRHGTRGKGLILDLLAIAGHAQAQKAMRDALESDAARETGNAYGMLFQRFAFVAKPDAGTVELATRCFRRGDPGVRGVAAVTMGAIVRKLQGGPDDATARALNQELVDGLKRAGTAGERRALIMALGNTHVGDDAQVIRGYARDDDPLVRAQTARSLASFDGSETRTTLFQMATDGDPTVASDAYASLAYASPTPGEWASFAQLAAGQDANVDADASLVRLIQQRRGEMGASADAILRAVLARTPASSTELRAMVLRLLQGEDAAL
jgi:hypothetical protein